MKQRLETLDKDFKTYHYALADLIAAKDEATLKHEQETLDNHDDEVAVLAICVWQLISAFAPSSNTNPRKIASHRLTHLQKSLSLVVEAIKGLSGDCDDALLLCQHEEQLADLKKELRDIRTSLLSVDLKDGDELNGLQTSLERLCLTVVNQESLEASHP